jgi:hypothetical protein
VFDHRCILAECCDNMRGVDPERFYHFADGMFPPDSLIFPYCFCNRFCGAAVGHDIT